MSAPDGGGREVAYRLFAAEYDDASLEYAESDEERAPNYVITPTGARVNRLFVVGTLTEVTRVNEEMLRARVVDPTGAFVVYAGQYQPDQLAFLERAEPPAFVAVTGKARTFQPEDSDRVYTSVRPESIATVDADTRDRWVVGTAEQTVERIATYAAAAELDARGEALTTALAESGVPEGLAAGIPLAQDHYGTTPAYLEALHELSLDAVRVVADERDEVAPFDRRPDEAGDGTATFAALADLDGIDVDAAAERIPDEASEATGVSEPAADEGEAALESDATAADTATETAETAEADAAAIDESETETAEAATDESEATVDEEPATATGATDAGAADDESASDLETSATATEADSSAEPDEQETASFDESTDVAESAGTEVETGSADADLAATDGEMDLESETGSEDGELGDFQSSGLSDDMYEMDDEEREQLEEEFGAEFTTGAEVEEAGEADIDVPEPGEAETGADADGAVESESETESEPASESEQTDESAADAADETEAEAADETAESDEVDLEDVDLQEYVVDTMRDLDEGDGADRTEVVATVAEETGADEGDVEDAIEDALMGGQCYEPNDETLKPI